MISGETHPKKAFNTGKLGFSSALLVTKKAGALRKVPRLVGFIWSEMTNQSTTTLIWATDWLALIQPPLLEQESGFASLSLTRQLHQHL